MHDRNEGSYDAGALLISDSDRDQISAVLSEHMAEGRLTVDELEQRVGRLYEARTRAQAALLLADLPPLEAPEEGAHFHIGHEDEASSLALPDWCTPGLLEERRWEVASPAPPMSHAQERAAERKRAKHHQDENAIGHLFQARRRVLASRIEAATAVGDRGSVGRLNAELEQAKETAAAARRALAGGDRAEMQRLLELLRRSD